jgi:hypothetical protein
VDVFKLLKRATDLGVQVFLFGYGEGLEKQEEIQVCRTKFTART